MKVENIDVSAAINEAKDLLKNNKKIPLSVKIILELLIKIITLLLNKISLNSRTSSKPPSSDPIGSRKKNKDDKDDKDKKKKKKPGGQIGHEGKTLEQVKHPDKIEKFVVDRKDLPEGTYKSIGFEARQVFDIKISTYVTEYRSEIVEDSEGNRYVAEFPEGVKNPTQYGNSVKAHSVYMSQFQLIPLDRVKDYFNDQMGLPLSKGSVSNFNAAAHRRLEAFENWARAKCKKSALLKADETGVNISGKSFWFHLLSNKEVALFQVDLKRGTEAMERMGILPNYKGTVCHDHWKPYYTYDFTHALCNAHHLRELERAFEQDDQKWAEKMKTLLNAINEEVKKTKHNKLSKKRIAYYTEEYRSILSDGEKESPLALRAKGDKKKGRVAQTKSRNLLDRLRNFEDDCLRFMKESIVPFTNNQAENDLRMTKVQQKISGCFRSLSGAQSFCRIKSYLLTCKRYDIEPTEALELLFDGKTPAFMCE